MASLRQRLSNMYMEKCPYGLFALSFNMMYGDKKKIHIQRSKAYDGWYIYGKEPNDSELYSPTPKFLNIHVRNFEEVFEKHFKIEPGDTCLDVGACIGDTTIFIRKKTGDSGKVIAVEPSSINLRFLRLNLNYPNVIIIDKATSSKKGTTEFYTNWTLTSNSLIRHVNGMGVETVETDTIDNMLNGTHINFAKIDVQGSEADVLKGADNLLKTVDKLIVETHWRTDDRRTYPAVLDIVKKYDFPNLKFELETGLVYGWRRQR